MEPLVPIVGPLLFARGADGRDCRLSAVAAVREETPLPALTVEGATIAPRLLAERAGWRIFGHDFALPAGPGAAYSFGDRRFEVATDLSGDLAVAFVSCNGQESGDMERPVAERDALWERLTREHARRPFSLLLQGGDQLYADEALQSHPETNRWFEASVEEKPRFRFTEEMREATRRFFVARYLTLLSQPGIAGMCARVPSIMMWDDHDIMDGWGSHPAPWQESEVGQGVFAVAREMFQLFQLGAAPDEPAPLVPGYEGSTFSLGARFPRLRVLAPDLRSERTKARVMGEGGWRAFEALLGAAKTGERVLILSSVPALGPRLSLVERLLARLPRTQDYEDDLRDQWQSLAHRDEWRRFLAALEAAMGRGVAVTLLSGEIHLATRATMQLLDGKLLHQLVASGIAHPAPGKAYAVSLGLLAGLGEAPLPGRPIRVHPLPGQKRRYAAERNYLVLERHGERWTAAWELEDSGRTAEIEV